MPTHSLSRVARFALLLTLGLLIGPQIPVLGAPAWIWIEGEAPAVNRMNRHPWWYDQVKRDQLSGGDLISNFSQDKIGEAEYRFTAASAGSYDFWIRANPIQATLVYRLNAGPEQTIDLERDQQDSVNIAADGKPDLRFVTWVSVGKVSLKAGANIITFRMTSANNHHGMIDCFMFTTEVFSPRGALKPDQLAAARQQRASDLGWFAFDPPEDRFVDSAIDLRFLNEQFAGEHGFIEAREGRFVHGQGGEPVRFWAVNGPPGNTRDPAELRRAARLLAKYGVNLVRVHGALFDQRGEADLIKVRRALDVVDAMKVEGIYTHFSIYFPLWFKPARDLDWLPGYDGETFPFATLQFNPAFQERFRKWWTALLTTPSEKTGKALVDEPAVMGLEIQNEDSFFFWTFAKERIPEPQWRILEQQFGDWLKGRYGSIDAALAKWGGAKEPRDNPAEGRVTFRPLWNMANQKTPRDQDTVQFLFEVQSRFYRETHAFLRKLGFKGRITASNWATASPEVLGPIEKLSYTTTDFIDRHGYFSCAHKGENAEWSIRDGHTYADRSALRFDAEKPGGPKAFLHPVMDLHYDDKPSMISETTFTRPNRYRTEAPLYFSAYGALQDTDGLVHFAFDGARWAVKPGFWMQPWTLMSPVMLGQFPAAALIYRRGLVKPGAVLATVNLSTNDLLALKGTPLPQDASFDELRAKDVPQGTEVKPGQRIDPLIHYAGRTQARFGGESSVALQDLKPLINRAAQTVNSSTRELRLDYRNGVMVIDAPQAQGVNGSLKAVGQIETRDLSIRSDLEVGAMVVVSLDNQPLAISSRMLLQVMSEEKAAGFTTEPVEGGLKRIVSIGRDPWMVRDLSGTVTFKRADARSLKVTALDLNGHPAGEAGTANELQLQSKTVYYRISR